MKYLYVNGCSFTFGSELTSKEKRWSSIVAKKLGLEEINESKEGGGNQRIFRKTIDWVVDNQDKVDETLFIIQWSYQGRTEIYTGSEINRPYTHLPFGYWDTDWNYMYGVGMDWNRVDLYINSENIRGQKQEIINGHRSQHLFIMEYWDELTNQSLRNIFSIQTLLKNMNAKYIFFPGFTEFFTDSKESLWKQIDMKQFLNFGKYKSFQHWAYMNYSLKKEGHPDEDANKELAKKLISIYEKD